MITRGKFIFCIIAGVIAGIVFSFKALHVFAVRDAPVVTGRVVARESASGYFVMPGAGADFTIQIEGTDTKVHARAARYLVNKIPDTVRFHYNGDPGREVFLFEHEENPWWISLFFSGAALALALGMKSGRVRRSLGWEK